MRTSIITLALAMVLSAALWCSSSVAQTTWTAAELAERTLQRRAVEAAIWGMPLVNFDAMRQAYFRDASAQYNDVMYWSKPPDWKNQTAPPNHSTNYLWPRIRQSCAGAGGHPDADQCAARALLDHPESMPSAT